MKVTLAVLADYSNVTKEGKLNILGIFDTIFAQKFPATHHNMQLVMRLEAPRSEIGTDKNVQVRLIDEDGKQIIEIGTQFTLPTTETVEPFIKRDHVLNLNNLVFQRPGDYSFHILINGEEKKSVPLKLIQPQPKEYLQATDFQVYEKRR